MSGASAGTEITTLPVVFPCADTPVDIALFTAVCAIPVLYKVVPSVFIKLKVTVVNVSVKE